MATWWVPAPRSRPQPRRCRLQRQSLLRPPPAPACPPQRCWHRRPIQAPRRARSPAPPAKRRPRPPPKARATSAPRSAVLLEIGDRNARRAYGSVAAGPGTAVITANTKLPWASASKWMYAAYVAQRQAGELGAADVRLLTMRGGYVNLENCRADQTVDQCLAWRGNGAYSPTPTAASTTTAATCRTRQPDRLGRAGHGRPGDRDAFAARCRSGVQLPAGPTGGRGGRYGQRLCGLPAQGHVRRAPDRYPSGHIVGLCEPECLPQRRGRLLARPGR